VFPTGFSPRVGRALKSVSAAVAINQMALIAVFPVLTRLYPNFEFSLYQVAFSISVVAQTIFTGGLEYFIPAATTAVDAKRLVRRCRIYVVVSSMVVASGALAAFLIGYRDVALVIVVSGLLALGLAVTAIDNASLIRDQQSKVMVRRNYLSALLAPAGQIFFGLILPLAVLLPFCILAARLAAVLFVKIDRETEVVSRGSSAKVTSTSADTCTTSPATFAV